MSQNGKGETVKYIVLVAFLASLFLINSSFPVDSTPGKISSTKLALTINSEQPATINLDCLKLFASNVEAIKKSEGSERGKIVSIYFQRAWTPVSKTRNYIVRPEMFMGEFISSKRLINISEEPRSFLMVSLSLNPNQGIPDNIMFLPENKASDTLYLYPDEYDGQSEQLHLLPIAALSPDGKVIPLGEYLLDQGYLAKKFQIFLNDINLACAQYLKTMETVAAIK